MLPSYIFCAFCPYCSFKYLFSPCYRRSFYSSPQLSPFLILPHLLSLSSPYYTTTIPLNPPTQPQTTPYSHTHTLLLHTHTCAHTHTHLLTHTHSFCTHTYAHTIFPPPYQEAHILSLLQPKHPALTRSEALLSECLGSMNLLLTHVLPVK